ncbi:putative receptor-like protein kinase [Camellia lanceoleosa]|uniref:Receptor-like protein kinase n=1 Tax=Camellia lanceoleosa TaxID=1840588 RepID=A0ACC0IMZ2_9ERIC|nr:putative receptor-like protein kinase [Camellia lanceoleosa]
MFSGDFDLNSSKGSLVWTLVLTDWCWSLVKVGNMEEALDRSLLREIGEGDEPSANVKAVVERFLAVGVLCTHAMVSVRPIILDAIKMLEEDVEVPTVPERPTPLMKN